MASRRFYAELQAEAGMNLSFVSHARKLADSIVESIQSIETVVQACYQQVFSSSLHVEKNSLSASQSRLLEAVEKTRCGLRILCEELDMQHHTNGKIGFPPKVFDACLFTVSLLQVRP